MKNSTRRELSNDVSHVATRRKVTSQLKLEEIRPGRGDLTLRQPQGGQVR